MAVKWTINNNEIYILFLSQIFTYYRTLGKLLNQLLPYATRIILVFVLSHGKHIFSCVGIDTEKINVTATLET